MRLKIAIIICSLFIMALIPMVEKNFGATVVMKRWSQLSWDDFQGIRRPFSAYAAVISSNIFLEYDSISERHAAYAAQNNQLSWVMRDLYNPDYALNHEQRHFDISEIHSRMLNQQLDSLEEGDDPELLLETHRMLLNFMQSRFDNETDHGLRIDIQRSWEYKIDSMLQHYEEHNGYVTEYYSGAKTYFPSSPEYEELVNDEGLAKAYYLDKYDMRLSTTVLQRPDWSDVEFNALSKYSLPADSVVLLSFERIGSEYGQMIKATAMDTVNGHRQLSRYYFQKPNLYWLYAAYPLDRTDTAGYELIADSFFNSFSIVNTDKYFLSKIEDSYKIGVSAIGPEVGANDKAQDECIRYMYSMPYGFFRGPIYNTAGDMLLAHDVMRHEDSALSNNLLVIDSKLFMGETFERDQLILIPSQQLSSDPHWASFGYFLREDTSSVCFNYYNQMIFIDPGISNSAESHVEKDIDLDL